MDWPVCKLQACNLVLVKFAQAEKQKVNKHPMFDNKYDIRSQLEHFEYDIKETTNKIDNFSKPYGTSSLVYLCLYVN